VIAFCGYLYRFGDKQYKNTGTTDEQKQMIDHRATHLLTLVILLLLNTIPSQGAPQSIFSKPLILNT
jgi:hypothetical protein